jgi:peptidyl-prolyl cis-trans isomerase C
MQGPPVLSARDRVFKGTDKSMAVCKRWVVLCAVVLLLAACQGKPPSGRDGNAILAKVNGTPITEEDIKISLSRGHGRPAEVQAGKEFLDDVIVEVLMYQQGLKLGLDKESGYKAFIAKKQNQVPRAQWREMKRRVINNQIAAKIEISNKDARDYYEKNAGRMATQLHLLFIKVKDKEAADKALKKISGGASFEAVARPLMGDTKVDGREAWDLGFVKWDKIPVDFLDAVYRLKPGEVSDVMGSQLAGFQIVKVLAKKKVPVVAFSASQGIVMNRLRDLKMLESYNQYVALLKNNAKIEKF